MGCRDIRETISACVDGEASPGEAASVREHLASCERCRVLERQMRAVGAGVRQVRGSVPDRFREAVFARLGAEGALPPRKKVFPTAWRWAAVPLAAAAALGFFLLTPGDGIREHATPPTTAARMASPVSSAPLTTEDREMIALLDLLEDPAAFDPTGDAEEMELLAPGDSADSPHRPRGGRSGA
ncbi:anti-sigma factor [Candidatus Deferrimicrobium sp.]|uniref:anti-sigma factor family protein n=1 Tax=Candidatus Deferrimicrobium sp. TaxID=3060586 RepID=UPI0027166E8E|nr:zf-HC2 domain-containing protein [Candidatus Deferrimicrobium sp.]MDO8737953.1 anti-sigma factor [Candidatus Deferrimicrobium sp.]MDP2658072.1 anti-sigma factor [Candidatus Deferrimicrobium sp.]